MGANWLYQRIKDKRNSNRDTVLRFSSEDAPYYWLLRWLETMPRQDSLSVFRVMQTTSESNGNSGPASVEPPGSSGRRPKPQPAVLIPTEGVTFKFREVKCTLEKSDAPPTSNDYQNRKRDLTLRIESRDPAISIALLEEISVAAFAKSEAPRVFVYQWHWTAVRKCPTGRAAILPNGDYESLAEDLRQFRDSEEWYRDVGLPFRRGYLLHGIAGSGKTTAVIALAGDFNLNVCVLSLASVTDETLLEAVRSMPADSILLLEDIDCAWAERKSADDKALTFSGLLNVLDGAATPEGRITFMTTNHKEKLDAALIRPGRVDQELEFRHATDQQIAELAHRFSKSSPIDAKAWASEHVSMAQVQERLIRMYRKPSHAQPRLEVVA